MGKIRGTHSSPGIYTKMTDLSYSSKNYGVTTLGLAGETLQGPAFEPIKISDWSEYVNYFGGTSAEIFKGSQYPKYELPYIAKSYLSASDQLYVCRVLGLSGYNAGSAFVITASNSGSTGSTKYVVAVLRPTGKHKKYSNEGDECNPNPKYDQIDFNCDSVTLEAYHPSIVNVNCGALSAETTDADFSISNIDFGRFNIVTHKGSTTHSYPVSLNYGSKDYIYNVLGNSADSEADVYVEELYDYMLSELIDKGKVNVINNDVKTYKQLEITPFAEPVDDFLRIPSNHLVASMNGKRYVYASEYFDGEGSSTGQTECYVLSGSTYVKCAENLTEGKVYGVKKIYKDDGYIYAYIKESNETGDTVGSVVTGTTANTLRSVFVKSANSFVENVSNKVYVLKSEHDFSDYKEGYRCAVTPWIVSELKGDSKNIDVKKLFRFYTISDGSSANSLFKISIANIKPEDGTFDVQVRDFYDTDANPVFLETYRNLSMRRGDERYIAMKIGTIDGKYEIKSKYIALEIIENDKTAECVPCGFLGYPTRNYGTGYKAPSFSYNKVLAEGKVKKQYFGISDITGIDVDMLSYKGRLAYSDDYSSNNYTSAFHLDSTVSSEINAKLNTTITVDGVTGMTWDAVSATGNGSKAPVIGYEYEMEGTIYEDVKARKFTVCFYGGFDGWDIYRQSRSNTDEFSYAKYKGNIDKGMGQSFSTISDNRALSLSGKSLNTDYYAYLAAARKFEDRDKVEINLFATPGIDYVNNGMLVSEIIDMVEERLDTFYVATTPDKPFNVSDAEDEMYSSSEAASNLEDSDISTYIASTYYPWIKYEDKDNNVYINLPVTKDVLRNMANTDNKRFPWIAPAGLERGNVECANIHSFTKLEDRDNVYDERINALMKFSKDGVKVWGNKTMYECEETNPFSRINCVRLMLYMRKLIIDATNGLIFEPNDQTLKEEFESIVKPILLGIKTDRGITDFKLDVSQTKEEMDAHELSCRLWVKPTPTLEYIEIEFMVTPQGIEFDVNA